MLHVPLLSHPSTPCPCVRECSARVEILDTGRLSLEYSLFGDIAQLSIPEPAHAQRTDGLWRHTCFELFTRRPDARNYSEFNFSPSGDWAIYNFEDCRQGMKVRPSKAPRMSRTANKHQFTLAVTLPLAGLEEFRGEVQLAVTAVVEDRAGRIYYWAAKHAADRPDFHHPDSFVLRLAPGTGETR